MTPQEIRELLSQTLDDRRVTRSEKRALNNILDDIDPTPQTLALYRSAAFELAREAVNDGQSKEVVEWLEDVVKLLQPPTTPQNQVISEACFSPGDTCVSRIVALFKRVQNSADVCVFTITDNRIRDAILDAHRRRVDVRIITDNDKASDLGSDIDDLRDAGVPVRMDASEYHMHHKFALFDGLILLTGSYNWTRGAANYNEENLILTTENRLVQSFAETFEELWDKFAD